MLLRASIWRPGAAFKRASEDRLRMVRRVQFLMRWGFTLLLMIFDALVRFAIEAE